MLTKGLIAAARKAEKQVGIYTTNGLIRGNFIRCKNVSVIQEIVAKLKHLRRDGVASDSSTFKELKRELRRLQRLSIYNKSKDDAFRLERLIHEDKPKFWKKVKSQRKLSKKRARITSQKPSTEEFIEFYKTLFSHHDRGSSMEHQRIESEVVDYNVSITDISCGDCFSIDDVAKCIGKLRIGKASGFDSISNEFFRYGNYTNLTIFLANFFNNIIKNGTIPECFNVSLLHPIPKKSELSAPTDYRPISVSSAVATLFEHLLLDKLPWLEQFDPCQFGYKSNTSCKSAFFVANETIQFYKF